MKLLVPVDYSEHSRAVLTFALNLASTVSGEVTVAHVWETQPQVPEHLSITMPDGTKRKLAEVVREEAERAMAEFMTAQETPAGLTVTRRMLAGSAAASIVREAAEGHFDLIVIGTHGRTGAGRALLGSVAEKVVRTSPVPVLTVPLPGRGEP